MDHFLIQQKLETLRLSTKLKLEYDKPHIYFELFSSLIRCSDNNINYFLNIANNHIVKLFAETFVVVIDMATMITISTDCRSFKLNAYSNTGIKITGRYWQIKNRLNQYIFSELPLSMTLSTMLHDITQLLIEIPNNYLSTNDSDN